MTFELTMANVIAMVVFQAGALWTILKVIAMQAQRRADEKFAALQASLDEVAKAVARDSEQIHLLEIAMLRNQADVARDYVRRDDFVQVIGTLNTRFDNFALRIEAVVLSNRGGKQS